MPPRVPFQRIDVAEAARLLTQDPAPLVLDIRDAQSYRQAHMPGALSASGVNLSEIIQGTARATPILVYCYHGISSQDFAQILSDFGHAPVYSLDGGFEAWAAHAPRTGAEAPLADPALRRWLAEEGFPEDDVNAIGANATTPLMRASHAGRADMVRALLDGGARLEARNADGNNALWLACVGEHREIIDLLVGAGIDIDNRNDNGATALMYAASSGKAAIVARLLEKGADPAPETLDGFTALDMAATADCLALLRHAARP
jgi:rhodanese-related sulfurtransferase